MIGGTDMAFVLSAFADEIGADLDLQIRVLRQAGIGYVEYRSSGGLNVSDHTLCQAREVAARLKDGEISFSALGSPIGKVDITADFAPHFDLFRHTLDLAVEVNAPYIRLFSFFIPAGMDPAIYRNKVMDQMASFVDAAHGSGVTLLHENEKEIYGDTPERCLDIFTTVNDPVLKATYDFSNFVQCGCDNRVAWKLLKEHVVYFHLKDSVYTDTKAQRDAGLKVTGNGHRPVGQGDGLCREILLDAYQSGFQGFASVEPHLGEEYGSTGEGRFMAAASAALTLIREIEVK
jgi:sugar phosphate isomerase/epimerase